MNILYFIYDLLFIAGFILYLPVYIFRRKINLSAFKEKMGFISFKNSKQAIWIQVVSVGEVVLIDSLIERLQQLYDNPIVISTTTLTGNKVAREKYSQRAEVIFFPFDLSCIIKKVIGIINPKLFIAVETEIWPNVFHCLDKKGIPIVIINGRISDKAFKRYKLIKPIVARILSKCKYIGVQNKRYRQRFIELGASTDKVIVSGNMKFESISIKKDLFPKNLDKYNLLSEEKKNLIFIAASTHFPEEQIVISIYKDIKNEFENITLVIAPRHPDRVNSIEKEVRSFEFNPVRMRELGKATFSKNSIYIIDTVGELLDYYSVADICFVGGSLSNDGGHNILEPIYFSKPTLFGPNMDNFLDIQNVVLERGAGIKVKDRDELKKVLLELLKNKDKRLDLKARCLEVFEEQGQSLNKNLELISKSL